MRTQSTNLREQIGYAHRPIRSHGILYDRQQLTLKRAVVTLRPQSQPLDDLIGCILDR